MAKSDDKTPYRMPSVELGDMVYWYPAGNTNDPTSAVVTRLGHDNLNMNLFTPASYSMPIRDGVRHVSDPNNSVEANIEGRWDFTPKHKRLEQLEARVTQLLEDLAKKAK